MEMFDTLRMYNEIVQAVGWGAVITFVGLLVVFNGLRLLRS